MGAVEIINVSAELDRAGLVWHPEIGDEIVERVELSRISILVDPLGMTPRQLRESFLWLPTVEQLIQQFEARQALIYHAGITETLSYETVIRTTFGVIETSASSLRLAFCQALEQLLKNAPTDAVH